MPITSLIGGAALTQREEDAQLRLDFAAFAQRCFRELNPLTALAMNWHVEVMTAKLAAVRAGQIRRLIVNVPPRHLKSLVGSVAFPAWCLGRQPGAQIICASYAQDLADKLARDCRRIMMSDWYQRAFPTRLSAQRQAVGEFETTAQGCRLATSVGGVLTGRGRRPDHHRRPAEARGGAVASPAPGGERLVRPYALQPAERQAEREDRRDHAPAARRRSRRPRAGPGRLGRRALPGNRRGRRDLGGRDAVGAAVFYPTPRRGIASRARAAGNARADPPDDRRI